MHTFKANQRLAQPRRNTFDPWNTSSTGHQTAGNRLTSSTAWKRLRAAKLNAQLYVRTPSSTTRFSQTSVTGVQLRDEPSTEPKDAGEGDYECAYGIEKNRYDHTNVSTEPHQISDTTSIDRNSRHKHGGCENSVTGLPEDFGRNLHRRRLRYFEPSNRTSSPFNLPTASRETIETSELLKPAQAETACSSSSPSKNCGINAKEQSKSEYDRQSMVHSRTMHPVRIFEHCVFYINCCTAPLVSDHRLRQLIAQHGGEISTTMSKRSVTHVVVSKNQDKKSGKATLAGKKANLEIRKTRGKGIKYIDVNWWVLLLHTSLIACSQPSCSAFHNLYSRVSLFEERLFDTDQSISCICLAIVIIR